jgi:hypothetical protein
MKYSHSKAMTVFYKIVKLVKNGVLMIIHSQKTTNSTGFASVVLTYFVAQTHAQYRLIAPHYYA